MKVSGRTIKLMAMGSTLIKMERDMKDIGEKISRMGKVRRLGPTVPSMKENMLRQKNKDKGSSIGLMAALILGALFGMILKVMGSTDGQTAVCTMDSGVTIKLKATGYSDGQTEEDTKDSILMTRKREEAIFSGLMEGNMRVIGRMENSTALASIHQHLDK